MFYKIGRTINPKDRLNRFAVDCRLRPRLSQLWRQMTQNQPLNGNCSRDTPIVGSAANGSTLAVIKSAKSVSCRVWSRCSNSSLVCNGVRAVRRCHRRDWRIRPRRRIARRRDHGRHFGRQHRHAHRRPKTLWHFSPSYELEAAGIHDDNLTTTARRNLVREAYRDSVSPQFFEEKIEGLGSVNRPKRK